MSENTEDLAEILSNIEKMAEECEANLFSDKMLTSLEAFQGALASFCKRIEALSVEEAYSYYPHIQALSGRLGQWKETLESRQTEIKQTLTEGTQKQEKAQHAYLKQNNLFSHINKQDDPIS